VVVFTHSYRAIAGGLFHKTSCIGEGFLRIWRHKALEAFSIQYKKPIPLACCRAAWPYLSRQNMMATTSTSGNQSHSDAKQKKIRGLQEWQVKLTLPCQIIPNNEQNGPMLEHSTLKWHNAPRHMPSPGSYDPLSCSSL
jgi:hypothetical protein